MVVPHTHWDREWYLPFQRFRVGLVRVLDEVLDAMAADPAYRFTMDGQLAAIEDYLELRPARRGDVARFVAEGRLAVGPWLILADEFLCSGETLLRNLEYGMRGAAALGGAMPVGYLPDQFGHCAQMPQMLALAGLRLACLWRGVPAHVDRDAFDWTGADGTTIRTGYLPGGYGNAFGLFTGPAEGMPDRVTAFVSTAEGWATGGTLLAMYGADHSAPAREITASGLRVATLAEALTGLPRPGDTGPGDTRPGGTGPGDGLPRVVGELRSHARANILPGVISARVPMKQAMARAERVLTRYAEPLSALWLADRSACERLLDRSACERLLDRSACERLLDFAWRSVIACSGHDSVTGCGSDETAQQVAARIAEAGQTAQAVVDLVAASLSEAAPKGALVVVNPSPFERTGLVLADLPEDRASLADASGRSVPVQRLEHAPTLLDETVMDDLSRLLGRVHERELYGHEIVSWHAGDGVFTVTVSRHASGAYAYEDLRRAVLEAGPGPWIVRTVAEPVVTVAALVTVPPLGRAVLTARPPGPGRPASVAGALRTDAYGFEPVLDNGLLRVRVAEDGTLSLRGADGAEVHGVGRIVHGGDAGDTYNHAPPPDDRLLDRPSRVVVDEIYSGPLTGAYEITRVYDWPAGAGDDETVPTAVTTRVELRAGEPFARCEITMDVRCRDHRVRWHAPLPRAAAGSHAEGQFAVVRRGLTAEGGGGERPIPTFPAESFAAAGGLAVLLDHVTEYEIVRDEAGGDGTEMALTLVRSVGYLSRNRNPYRDEPAGPEVPTPAAQCQGPLTVRFAVLPYAGEWHDAGLPRLAEEFRHDLLALPGTGAAGAYGPGGGGHLAISGDGVVMAALRERDGRLEVRLVAEHPTATEAVVRGDFTAAWTAGVLGSPLSPLEVSRDEVFPDVFSDDGADGQGPAAPWRTVRVPLKPFEIATVHLGGHLGRA
ncbi:alpha-mannosidase [Microbispora sp. CA-102843]|uniref:glycoside hydrolase family 38 N-terminal domain-containing protein n=1 Tax=Microbispora sp. CA-102843 TaxID=3239952 RepID=UPI003D8DF2F8